jgi:hypothetical protein
MNTIDSNKKEKPMHSDRKIASIAGVLFILGTVTALVGDGLTESTLSAPDYLTRMSAHGTQIMIGALFTLISALVSGSIAISLYPVLKKYNEALALGAVGFRLIEPVFYIVGVMSILALLLVSQEFVKAGSPAASSFQLFGTLALAIHTWAYYVFGVVAYSLGALMYYVVFYQARLIPRWLAGWGCIGEALALAAAVFMMFGLTPNSPLMVALILPIAVQEMVLAGWLIVKGFNPAATASQFAKPTANEKSSTRENRMDFSKIA